MKTASVVVAMLLVMAGSVLAAPSSCNNMTIAQLVSGSTAAGQASGANNGCTITYNNVVYKFDYFSFSDSSSSAINTSAITLNTTSVSGSQAATMRFTYNDGNVTQFDASTMDVKNGMRKIDFNLSFQLVNLGYNINQSLLGMNIDANMQALGGATKYERGVTPQGGSMTNIAVQGSGVQSATGTFASALAQFTVLNHFYLDATNGTATAAYFRNTLVFNPDSIFNQLPGGPVPEPTTLSLMGLSLVGLVAWKRRAKK